MTDDEAVLYEQRDGVVTITMNRPEVRNALNREVSRGLRSAIARLSADDSRIGILTGNGLAFSSGANLKDPSVHATANVADYHEGEDNSLYDDLMRCPKPVIAAVNGSAHGAGATLAIACDLRVFSTDAYAVWPMVRLGIIPANGTMVRLARIVGSGHALEIVLMAKKVDAEEAFRIGMANRVVPSDQLLPAALEMAATIASAAPIALRFAKEALYRGIDMGLHDAINADRYRMLALYNTDDRKEASKAWLEKRPPHFTGR